MKFAIFGVGGYFGGKLAQAGEDVTFIARGENLHAMKTSGLRVDSIQGDFLLARVQAADSTESLRDLDVILLATKAWQLDSALESIKTMLGERTMILPLLNGMEHIDILRAEFGEHLLGGLCRISSFLIAPAHVSHLAINPLIAFNEWKKNSSSRVSALRDVFSKIKEITVETPPDIELAMWEKYLLICAFSGVGGLMDYKARFYSPMLGRFLQPDSLIPDPANPQAWNRFSYVTNNPVNFNDPSGHQKEKDTEASGYKQHREEERARREEQIEQDKVAKSVGFADLISFQSWAKDNKIKNPDKLLDSLTGNIGGSPSISTPTTPFSYCGGGSNGIANLFDCLATVTQDIALLIDIPFAGSELAFTALGCLGGLQGCAAGIALGQEFFNLTGANAVETGLSGFSAGFSFLADWAEHGLIYINEPTVTAFAGAGVGALSPDPILDFIIDGYGSGYNHDVFNGVYSFNPFDSNPIIR